MQTLQTILHPTDFSSCAERALDHALFLARAYGAGLHVVHVVEIPALGIPYVREDYFVARRREALEAMRGLLATRDTHGVRVTEAVLPGPVATPAAPTLLEYAQEYDAGFIVMGTHGLRGFRRLVMGSVAQELVRSAPCSVLTVPESAFFTPGTVKRVLVPVDFSEVGERALHQAVELARHYQARLLLLHVIEDVVRLPGIYGLGDDVLPTVIEQMENRANEEMQRLASVLAQQGLAVERHLEQGHAADCILDFAQKQRADLIVMATHGRTGIDRLLLGSVAERVMRTAARPVVVVRAPHAERDPFRKAERSERVEG